MKKLSSLFILFSALLAGCTHSKKTNELKEIHPIGIETVDAKGLTDTDMDLHNMTKVRNKEVLKAYPVGRYVDPNDSNVMHEAHTIYVEEIGSTWNLSPNEPTAVPMGDTIAIACPEREPKLSQNELVLQFNALRSEMERLKDENQKLREELDLQDYKIEKVNTTVNDVAKAKDKMKKK